MNPVSPALRSESQAYELKFLIPADLGRSVAAWARETMCPDPYGAIRHDGRYAIQTLYLDTADSAVAHARPGFRTTKLRVRRYGTEDLLYLEAKSKRGDRVKKRRAQVTENELALLRAGIAPSEWQGRFFLDIALAKGLAPAAVVTYQRLAFVGGGARLTLDDRLAAAPERRWNVPKEACERSLALEGQVLELKFADAMPTMFRQAIREFQLTPMRVSKYRTARQCLAHEAAEDACLIG